MARREGVRVREDVSKMGSRWDNDAVGKEKISPDGGGPAHLPHSLLLVSHVL